MNKLFEFFSDNDGSMSASRLILIMYATVIIGAWSYISIKSTTLTPVPESVITMLGLAIGGKIIQKPFESKG